MTNYLRSVEDFSNSSANWELEVWSVKKFNDYINSIDTNPVEQRGDVILNYIGRAHPSKQQSIIAVIFQNRDLGEIKLTTNPSGSFRKWKSNDGGHRKRSLIAFKNNRFPLHRSSPLGEKYFNELTEEQQERFLNYRLRMVFYPVLSGEENAAAFAQSSNSTPVNFPERMNGFGDTPVANMIRNTVRVVPGVNDEPIHPLFKNFFKRDKHGNISENRYEYFTYDNSRFKHDNVLMRIVTNVWLFDKTKGNDAEFGLCDEEKIHNLYKASISQKEADVLWKKSKDCLDFIHKIAKAKYQLRNKNGLNGNEMTMLYRLFFYFSQKCGYNSFKVLDSHNFYEHFSECFLKFTATSQKKKNKKGISILVKRDHSIVSTIVHFGSRDQTIAEAFKWGLTRNEDRIIMKQVMTWFFDPNLGGFDPIGRELLRPLDPVRFFKKEDVVRQWIAQGRKCGVTGLPLEFSDAQGAHIHSHKRGGWTTLDNLVVVSSEHNRAMGEMNANDYKARYLAQNKKAA